METLAYLVMFFGAMALIMYVFARSASTKKESVNGERKQAREFAIGVAGLLTVAIVILAILMNLGL